MGFIAFFRLVLLSWPILLWLRRKYGRRTMSRRPASSRVRADRSA